MVRLFDRNMFIMMLAIMLGVIVITFFIADILKNSELKQIETKHDSQIKNLQIKNENFTSRFIRSNVILDQARENRATGNYHFDLGLIWYQSALSEKNYTYFESYKIRGVNNCTEAMPEFNKSYNNFLESQKYFIQTKLNTTNPKYIEVVDLYINLTNIGANLTKNQNKASQYLKILTENLIFNKQNNSVGYMKNLTEEIGLFEDLIELIDEIEEDFKDEKEKIDEYEFFDEIR